MADNTIINPGSGGDAIATDDIGGVKFQRVKVTHGADGSATDVSSANPLPVDTELPAAAALSDSTANPTAPMVGAAGMVWNGSAWVRAASATALGDGASPIGSLAVGNYLNVPGGNNWSRAKSIDGKGDADTGSGVAAESPMLYNGSSFDRQRGNTEEAYVLAPAARTVGVNSPDLYNYNARGARITLNVTAKAGATTLTPTFYTYAGGYCILGAPFAAWAAGAGTTASFDMYPGIPVVGSGATQSQAFMLPRHWILNIQQSDSDSITYSASVQYIV